MALDHEAIYKAYAGTVVSIDDGAGAFDASGSSVTLDQTKIDAARATLDAEAAAVKYKTDRTTRWFNHLRFILAISWICLYKDIVAGTVTTSGTWATHIKAVKDANPKP